MLLPDPQMWCRPREARKWRWRARFWHQSGPWWGLTLYANVCACGIFVASRGAWSWWGLGACVVLFLLQVAFAVLTQGWADGDGIARQLEADHRVNVERLDR